MRARGRKEREDRGLEYVGCSRGLSSYSPRPAEDKKEPFSLSFFLHLPRLFILLFGLCSILSQRGVKAERGSVLAYSAARARG